MAHMNSYMWNTVCRSSDPFLIIFKNRPYNEIWRYVEINKKNTSLILEIFENTLVFAGGRDIVCLTRNDVPVQLTLDCGPNIINMTYSNYGRTEPYSVMCPHPHGPSEDDTCTSPIWDQLDTCDGLRSCQKEVVLSGNDPCYMTGKYAEVRYICQGEI